MREHIPRYNRPPFLIVQLSQGRAHREISGHDFAEAVHTSCARTYELPGFQTGFYGDKGNGNPPLGHRQRNEFQFTARIFLFEEKKKKINRNHLSAARILRISEEEITRERFTSPSFYRFFRSNVGYLFHQGVAPSG